MLILKRNLSSQKAEAVTQRCSVEKVFLEILQNSQENTCARACNFIKKILTQVFSCEFCEISKDTFSYRTPSVAASEKEEFINYLITVVWLLGKSTGSF